MDGRDGGGKGAGVLSAWRWGHVAQEVEAEGRLEPVQDKINYKNLANILSRYVLKEYRCYYQKEGRLQTEELPQKGELLQTEELPQKNQLLHPLFRESLLLKNRSESKVWPWLWGSWLGTCWG